MLDRQFLPSVLSRAKRTGGSEQKNSRLKTPQPEPPQICEFKGQKFDDTLLDHNANDIIAKALRAAAKAASAAATARANVQNKTAQVQHPDTDVGTQENIPAVEIEEPVVPEPLKPYEPWRTTPNRIAEIITTLRANPDKAEVQQWAGLVLDDFDWDDRARECLVSCGGVEGLVASLAAHAANPDVQRTLCSALAAVATVPEGRVRAAKAGAAERLFSTMATHSARPDVLVAALRALLPLLWDEPIRNWIRNGGGAASVQQCMRAHPAHAGVQEWGARALGCLAADRGPRVRLGPGGAVDALLGALGALRDDPPALGAATWALTAAALQKDNLARILRSPAPRLRALAEALGPPVRPAP